MASGSVQSTTLTNGGITPSFIIISFLIGGQVNDGNFTWLNQFFKVFLPFLLYSLGNMVGK